MSEGKDSKKQEQKPAKSVGGAESTGSDTNPTVVKTKKGGYLDVKKLSIKVSHPLYRILY